MVSGARDIAMADSKRSLLRSVRGRDEQRRRRSQRFLVRNKGARRGRVVGFHRGENRRLGNWGASAAKGGDRTTPKLVRPRARLMRLGIDVGRWSDYDFAPLGETCSSFAESKTANTKSATAHARQPRKSDARAVKNPSTFTSAHSVTGTTGTYPTKPRSGKVSNLPAPRPSAVTSKRLAETFAPNSAGWSKPKSNVKRSRRRPAGKQSRFNRITTKPSVPSKRW